MIWVLTVLLAIVSLLWYREVTRRQRIELERNLHREELREMAIALELTGIDPWESERPN